MFFEHLQDITARRRNKVSHSDFLLWKIRAYLKELHAELELRIDKRLARTFYSLFVIILMHRERAMGLLLSELGGYLCGFAHAPAGTKRISNLLRSPKWSAEQIDQFFFQRSIRRIKELQRQGQRALMLWDDSVVEKPESWFAQALGSVWSSKARRLTRIKPGYFTPPSTRICVPGFQWTAMLVSHLGGKPSVCRMDWWTTRGKFKEHGTNFIFRLLRDLQQQLDQSVLHVFDRGYARIGMLVQLLHFEQDFLIRWLSRYQLRHAAFGLQATHQISRRAERRSSRVVWDKVRKKQRRVNLSYEQVWHPDLPDQPLYLLIIRDRSTSSSPMYLVTNLVIDSSQLAWQLLFSYMHRWEVEQAFRFHKSELGIESIRLWFWGNRRKLMGMVSLVYDFLMQLLRGWPSVVQAMLRKWNHRTGAKQKAARTPIYRLRAAIAMCLLTGFLSILQNSG